MPAIWSAWPPWWKSANRIKNMETLNQDFLEFIGLLESHGVDYLIIGGVAYKQGAAHQDNREMLETLLNER